ncbi:hypothetical protein ACNKHO_02690 [Shigella flexneri]
MGQIQGALVGIAMVLSRSMIPTAFFGGSTGAFTVSLNHHRVSDGAIGTSGADPDPCPVSQRC